MKNTPKSPKKTETSSETEPDLLDGLTATLLGTLKTASAAVERTKGSDPSLVKQVIDGVTELRKLQAAQRKRHEDLTLPMIVAFLRQLAPEDRARVTRELHSMERQGGVLG